MFACTLCQYYNVYCLSIFTFSTWKPYLPLCFVSLNICCTAYDLYSFVLEFFCDEFLSLNSLCHSQLHVLGEKISSFVEYPAAPRSNEARMSTCWNFWYNLWYWGLIWVCQPIHINRLTFFQVLIWKLNAICELHHF